MGNKNSISKPLPDPRPPMLTQDDIAGYQRLMSIYQGVGYSRYEALKDLQKICDEYKFEPIITFWDENGQKHHYCGLINLQKTNVYYNSVFFEKISGEKYKAFIYRPKTRDEP
ncbi:MAG TPA: hypothetical protein PKD85_01380 [Saprospiraceae bacterium]|nr:hypothetical protein [Saprospiraceae bacterium]